MSRTSGVLAAMKAVPGGARYTPAPQSGGWGGMNQVAANAQWGNPYAAANGYGPFLPRPSRTFSDGAFGPMSPIQPVPLDEPAAPGGFPDPRYWQYPVGWNLPTQPGTEGLKLASFSQLYTLASKYSVARQCIQLRKDEILGLNWQIELTTQAAKAYQNDHQAMRDFGERAAQATKFFRHPDPDYWTFGAWLAALLEEIFVYDALALIFRPKYGKGLGRGLLGSDLDSMRLVSGPTIRPLVGMHGEKPRPPAPAYQQFLYGVPRSDYQTIISGSDIDDYGLTGAEVNEFRADVMLYAPLVTSRETPYGFPPIERALLPVISGLQKQEFQLDYFTEGTIPAVYISPGDPNMTPTQIRELQDALNGVAGDPAYHLKVIVLPPGSKVDPQRPVDLSDSFDFLVMNQTCMAFDVSPVELGIVPDIGATSAGPSASGIKFNAQESRSIKSRKSTKPLLKFLCDICNYVLQDICGQQDMEFTFEGLRDEQDEAAIVSQGVELIQNGIYSIDEVRDLLDKPPWGLEETTEPVVFTAQGPIPLSMAKELIANLQGGGAQGAQGTNSGQRTTSSRTRNSQPTVRRGGQTKPNGCLAAETEIVTAGGVRPIRDLLGPQILLTDAGWVNAEIREFGVQELREVVLNRGSWTRSVFATPNHRWYLSDGSVQITDDLSVLDSIPFVSPLYFSNEQPRAGSFAVRASGTVREDTPGMQQVPSPSSAGRLLLARGQAAQAYGLQEVHGRPCSSMVAGAPQGAWRSGGAPGCGAAAQIRDHAHPVQLDAGSAGWQMPPVQERGNGPTSRDALATLGGPLSSVRAHTRAAVQQLQPQPGMAGKNGSLPSARVPDWKVVAVRPTARVERVYCAVVPALHRFVLADGILTGNSHPAPVAPHRESVTPAHSAAAGAVQSPGPRTGGTPSRSSVAGSRKKAVDSELAALARHLRKGRLISTWDARHIPTRALGMIAEDLAKGVLIDTAIERAGDICLKGDNPLYGSAIERSSDAAGELGYSAGMPGDDRPDDHLGNPGLLGKASHWPGWERDLGLVGAYKNLIGQAFHDAEAKGSDLRKKAATGGMFVSNSTLRDLISDEVRQVFSGVLTPLWTEAWHLGYAAAKSLVAGQPADFAVKGEDPEALAGWIASEGEHWLQQVARTGLGNNSTRSELIARTEIARAINSAAIQCYRDHGVAYKHLLLSPGACDICKDAAGDEVIPLDAPFSAGGVTGTVHPACRCVPAPAGVEAEPPLADLGKEWTVTFPRREFVDNGFTVKRGPLKLKSSAIEDDSRLAWLLLRARDEDGKWRFLLQQRPDGSWGMPGGKPHIGEDSWTAALRETEEEIGKFPPPYDCAGTFHHVEDDGKTQVYLYLCTVPYFHPTLDGATPEETRGAAWFRRKEIASLDLAPKFREDWEKGICLREHVTKALQRVVNENGETLTLTPASQALQAVGSRWPYPKRSDGSEWPDSGPGNAAGAMGASEPPHWDDDMAEPEPHDTLEPRGGDDGEMPAQGRKPNPPASAFPNQGTEHDEAWPEPRNTLQPPASSVGARTGVPPSGASKGDAGHPVTGSVPAQAPAPYAPHTIEPQAFDPAETVEEWSPEAGSNIVHDLPKGAQHVTDANPVEWRHVWAVMESNFPDSALEWVKHSTWAGPVNVPWSRVDDDDQDKWAAAHQPDAVGRFAREIAKGGKHTEPSILVHQANHSDGREKIIDGHHRAMARHFKLGKPVLAYVGTVPARWMQKALETHSSQLHQGADPANKGDAETLREYWTHEAHGGPTHFAYADEIAWGTPGDFMRAVRLLKEHAHMTDEQAKGYANLMHHRALGYWPAQHARMDGKSEA